MKAALLYRIIFAFMIAPMLLTAANNPDNKGKHTKEKKITKEFQVNANATIEVDNSYGNLDIVTWDENRVVFEITITTNGSNEEKVQKKLDDITVVFDASSSLVSATTKFNKNGSNSWWKWNTSGNVNMKINYVIKMPMSNSVNLSNDYGSINLDKLDGKAIISCDYGKITTKELMAENNKLSFDYTQNSYFEYINSGEINADYSGFTVAKAKKLIISADYTKSVVEIAEEVTYNCDYGSITIDKVNSVIGNGDYLTTRLGDVYKDVSLKADYGSIKIDKMTANAGDLEIESDYVGITIGYDSGYNFDFEINIEYGSLRDEDGLEFNKKNVESSSKYYTGYRGNSSSGNTVKINSEFGSISLDKN